MGSAAAPVSLAATGLSAFSKISAGNTAAGNALQQGQATSEADSFRAQDLSNQAATGRLAATQTDAYMREQTQAKMANLAVIGAAQNVDPSSPTSAAIANRTEQVADTNRQQRVLNITAKASQDDLASAYYQQAGVNALAAAQANASSDHTNGFLGALAAGLGGISGLKMDGLSVGNLSLPNNANGGLIGYG